MIAMKRLAQTSGSPVLPGALLTLIVQAVYRRISDQVGDHWRIPTVVCFLPFLPLQTRIGGGCWGKEEAEDCFWYRERVYLITV
jgi:hypothetical protein